MTDIFKYQFYLNPCSILDYYEFAEFDPLKQFKLDESIDIYKETNDVTKKNIFDKIIDVILKISRWIVDGLSKIVKGIKKISSKKIKTATQIAVELSLLKNELSNDINNSKNDMADNLGKIFIDSIENDHINLNVTKLVETDIDKSEIKGKKINGAGTRASMVIALMIDPSPLDEYINFFEDLLNEMSIKSITPKEIDKIQIICKNFKSRPSIGKYLADEIFNKVDKKYSNVSISIKNIAEFQIKVDTMCKVVEKFDNIRNELNLNIGDKGSNANNIEKHYMDILNELSWACVNLQGGLHAIANGMQNIYVINPEYWDTVDDINILAKFVDRCMRYGIPGKYLVYNIYKICKSEIKGSPDIDKPIMGFGRLTLIPDGDIIYKIAINRYGIRSNKNDFMVMDFVKDKPEIQQYFAITHKTYGDYIINVMEKVKAGSKYEPSMNKANELGKEINELLTKANAGFIIHDIKSDAFGQKNGKYVCLDYGYILRQSYKPVKNNKEEH